MPQEPKKRKPEPWRTEPTLPANFFEPRKAGPRVEYLKPQPPGLAAHARYVSGEVPLSAVPMPRSTGVAIDPRTPEGRALYNARIANRRQAMKHGTLPQQYRTAVEAPAVSADTNLLPEPYYNYMLKAEGGISTSKSDKAYAANPDAPLVGGERAHTNLGVQYRTFKDYAQANNIPEAEWKKKFLNLSERDAKNITDHMMSNAGLEHFESKVLRSLFADNLWMSGKIWGADFKQGRSDEYRALLDWLQSETGLDFQSTGKMSKEEAQAIEALYKKNPQGFIDSFRDKSKTHISKLDNASNNSGWTSRADSLHKMASGLLK